jgi:hypothetical protein
VDSPSPPTWSANFNGEQIPLTVDMLEITRSMDGKENNHHHKSTATYSSNSRIPDHSPVRRRREITTPSAVQRISIDQSPTALSRRAGKSKYASSIYPLLNSLNLAQIEIEIEIKVEKSKRILTAPATPPIVFATCIPRYDAGGKGVVMHLLAIGRAGRTHTVQYVAHINR